MKYFYTITILFFTNMHTLFSQAGAAQDSLMRLLLKVKDDSAGVELYIKAGDALGNNEPLQSTYYYLKAKSISEKINYKRGVTKSLIYYSGLLLNNGKPDSSIYYSKQALELAKQTGDSLYMGIITMNLGLSFQQLSEPEESIAYYMEGKRLIENSSDVQVKNIVMQMNASLQNLYNGRAQFDKANTYGELALKDAKILNNKAVMWQVLVSFSISYRETKQFAKAEQMAQQSLQIGIDLKDKRMEAAGLLAVASVWEKQGLYQKILPFVQRSLLLSRASAASDTEVISLTALAICYLQLNNFLKAEGYANEALTLSKKLQAKTEEADALRVLSRIAYATGRLEQGAKFDLQATELSETFIRESISLQSSNLEKKYETEKKNKEITQLKSDQKIKVLWNYILIGAFVTLFIIALLSYRTYLQKQKLQQQQITELEKEKQLLAAEAVLKGQEQERTRLAKDLHDGLGGMLSGIKYSFTTMKGNLVLTPHNALAFERSMDMLDSSIKELRMVAHNLMPENLVKFGLDTALKDFCSDITASGVLKVNYHSFGLEQLKINQNTEIIIYRIIQELINNIIKHAAAKEGIVQLELQNNQLQITVEDDGNGFDISSLDIANGIGWSNIKNRVEYLKATLNIVSENEKGTSITITINT